MKPTSPRPLISGTACGLAPQKRSPRTFPPGARSWRSVARSLSTRFTSPEGKIIEVEKAEIRVGTESTAELQISGPNSFAKHAEIRRSNAKTTCTALVGDEDDLLADTFTWLDGSQLRTGVGYLVSPATKLAFGHIENEFTIDFEEKKADSSMLEMLIKGMASQSSKEVQDQIDI